MRTKPFTGTNERIKGLAVLRRHGLKVFAVYTYYRLRHGNGVSVGG